MGKHLKSVVIATLVSVILCPFYLAQKQDKESIKNEGTSNRRSK